MCLSFKLRNNKKNKSNRRLLFDISHLTLKP